MTKQEYIQIQKEILSGNTRVLKDVIKRYRDVCLIKLCKQNQCKLEDAEEFFQDALMEWMDRLYKDKFEFRKENSVRVFLEGVCINKFRTKYNKEKRRKEIRSQIFPDSQDHASYQIDLIDPDDEALKYEAMQLALDSLKQNCNNILRLFYFGRLKMAKIAEMLGYSNQKSAGIVKNRCRNYWFKKSIEIYKSLKKD